MFFTTNRNHPSYHNKVASIKGKVMIVNLRTYSHVLHSETKWALLKTLCRN